MALLKWDQPGERQYEMGVKNGILYPQNSDGTYATGVVWNGLTAVTNSPDGAEPTDLWADNIKYATLRSAETFGATIEAYTYPEEFCACDGSAQVVAGVHVGQQARQPFGFCYRTEIGSDTMSADGDDGYIIHVIYNLTASPSERNYETINDSPDAITFSWEVTSTPVNCTGYKPVSEITFNSTELTAEKMTAIKNKLYGTDASGGGAGTDPTLPDPDTLLALAR